MKVGWLSIIKRILAVFPLILAVSVFPKLPEQVPTHWNIHGQVDSYSTKAIGAFFLPVISLAILVGFQVLPNLDPKKKKYQLFRREWEIIQTGLLGFFAYLHGLILYTALNPDVDVGKGVVVGIGSLLVLIGNYMGKIRQNYFLGIRTPWTLANEHVWNKTHRFASWFFVIGGLLMIVNGLMCGVMPQVFFLLIVSAVVLPVIYSLAVFKKKEQLFRNTVTVLFLVVALIATLRLFSGEDAWICENGTWIKHGNPDGPPPRRPCP